MCQCNSLEEDHHQYGERQRKQKKKQIEGFVRQADDSPNWQFSQSQVRSFPANQQLVNASLLTPLMDNVGCNPLTNNNNNNNNNIIPGHPAASEQQQGTQHFASLCTSSRIPQVFFCLCVKKKRKAIGAAVIFVGIFLPSAFSFVCLQISCLIMSSF